MFHLIEISVKTSQTHRPSKCATFNGAQHIFSLAKFFQIMILKSVHPFGTTAGVIRVKPTRLSEY